MAWISFVSVTLIFFLPPLKLAERVYQAALAQPVVVSVADFTVHIPAFLVLLGLLVGVWLVFMVAVCQPIALALRSQDWFRQLTEFSHPDSITRLCLFLCILIVLLAAGGLAVLNAVFETGYTLPRPTLALACFGLLAEAGRLVEAASWDEQSWKRANSRSAI
jgi:hypothetical protein